MRKLRKEKYIINRDDKYLVIRIKLGDGSIYTQNIKVSDYKSPVEAMNAAVHLRDQVLLFRLGMSTRSDLRLNAIMERYPDVYRQAFDTYREYKYLYKNYIKPVCGAYEISRVNLYQIQKSLNTAAETVGSRRLKYLMTLWRRLYRIARMSGFSGPDLTEQAEMPISQVVHKKHDATTSTEEMEAVIEELITSAKYESSRYNATIIAAAIRVMRYTGMRPAEVYALSRHDIDYRSGVIHCGLRVGRGPGGKMQIQKAKNEQSLRTVPMTSACRKELEYVMRITANEYIFQDYNGNFMNQSKISEKIAKISKKLGLSFRCYDLRHQFSTDLVTSGVDPRTVMELMGHQQISMTIQYARSDDDLKREAVDQIAVKNTSLCEQKGHS